MGGRDCAALFALADKRDTPAWLPLAPGNHSYLEEKFGLSREAQAVVAGAGSGPVCVLYTGGTIGMRSIQPELHPSESPLLAPEELKQQLEVRSDLDVAFDFQPLRGTEGREFTPVVSSKILPSDWSTIAETILDHYADYTGFVVLHGTDTLAWTASALSFMFGNLGKPVVLTGAQRPISTAPTDAVSNFVNAVMLAAGATDSIPLIPEVMVCFGDAVLRGNRSTKISVASLQGFDSPNAPHLGRVGRRFDIDADQLRPPPAHDDATYVRTRIEHRVADVMLYPGMPASVLRRILKGNRGAVLRTFGAGNAPGGPELQKVLREAVDKGKILVNVTQTNEGTVEAGMLTGTRALTDCGVLSGLDLTAEAALTKLMVLLGSEMPGVAGEQMQLDQRGEQSMDLLELRAISRRRSKEDASRIVLTRALQPRARPDRLVSAVLRVRSTADGPTDQEAKVALHLNHWWADRTSCQDARFVAEATVGGPRQGGPDWDVVVDVTHLCRGILRTGAPVTLTVVWSNGVEATELEAVLSLFTERVLTEE